MTDKNLTEIVAIIDRSGSMEAVREDSIGGFNAFLKKQQEDKVGRCLLTYTHFDHEYEVVHDHIDIQEMKPLDHTTFVPRGSTALLDAIGRTINTVGERLSKTIEEQRPGNVVVVILTDGLENYSREFTHAQIEKMVKHQIEKYNWSFIFLGQNIDAFSVGASIGLNKHSGGVYLGNMSSGGRGQVAAYHVASAAVSSRRAKSANSVCMDWSTLEKDSYTEALITSDDEESTSSSTPE